MVGMQLDLLGPLAVSTQRIKRDTVDMYARRSDPETSHAAGKRAAQFRSDHHRRILAALAMSSGTIYELAVLTGIDHVAVARRLPELERIGQAMPTGSTKPGPTGTKCRVWQAVKGTS